MKVIKFFLPGHFEDAHLYNGRLLLLTEEKTLRVFNFKHLVEEIEANLGEAKTVATLAFLHPYLLQSDAFQLLMQNRVLASAIRTAFDKFPQPYFLMYAPELKPQEQELEVPATVILDSIITNDQLFLGANTGFYVKNIGFEQYEKEQVVIGPTKKLMDNRCVSTSAKNSFITASCGEDGLHIFSENSKYSPTHLQKIWERSLRVSWQDSNLITYPTPSQPRYIHNRTQNGRNQIQRRNIENPFDGQPTDLSYSLFQTLYSNFELDKSTIQFVYNIGNTFFTHSRNECLYSTQFETKGRGLEFEFSGPVEYKSPVDRFLSGRQIKLGLILEADNAVWLFSSGQWYQIAEGSPLMVRSFPNSTYYQNIVTITLEDGVMIAGLIDDEAIGSTMEKS